MDKANESVKNSETAVMQALVTRRSTVVVLCGYGIIIGPISNKADTT